MFDLFGLGGDDDDNPDADGGFAIPIVDKPPAEDDEDEDE
jgi:hypothetical protein